MLGCKSETSSRIISEIPPGKDRSGKRERITRHALYSLGKVLYFILSGRTLAREEYAEGEDDLRTRDAGPGMHFVYELFDKTITERPQDRYQSAADLLYALDTVIERVQLKAHVLKPSLRQHCMFCVIGEYQPSLGSGSNDFPIFLQQLREQTEFCEHNSKTMVGEID